MISPDQLTLALPGGISVTQVASLSPSGAVFANNDEAAKRRRDLAVEGFLALRQTVESEGVSALTAFYGDAAELVKSKVAQWRQLWEAGPETPLVVREPRIYQRDGLRSD